MSDNLSDIENRAKKIIIEILNIEDKEINATASFTKDLGADELEAAELILEFEKQFEITIPENDQENLTTLGNVIAYIIKHAK
ncbi:acyl carrier protein [Pseudomonas sp. NPDC090233]|uniref:acyl carrier protein n=1 Tax=Pseudomonas sp. NPDC090233 TaxID=3364479 RepID=UPI00383B6E0A